MLDTAMNKWFLVPAQNLSSLNEKIEKLNRKVAKLAKKGYDVAPVSIETLDAVIWTVKFRGEEIERIAYPVYLNSPKAPKANGWEFIAALTHVEDVGAVIRVAPGVEISEGELAQYREASQRCEHCNVTRRRNDTYVLRSTEGKGYKQVGSSCLGEFLGMNPAAYCACAEYLLSAADILDSESGDDFEGGRGRSYRSIEFYLPWVAQSVRTTGWLSRGAAYANGGKATADDALSNISAYENPEARARYNVQPPEAQDVEMAQKIIAFMDENYGLEADVAGLTDFEANLRMAYLSGVVHPKLSGIIAAGIIVYKKDVERRARNTEWAEIAAKSTYQGTVGKRSVFTFKVVGQSERESQFGLTVIYRFLDANMNAYTYFSSRDLGINVGDEVEMKATVKKHEEYKGCKGTILTRGVVQSQNAAKLA